jgi:hypothetical protein
MRQAMTASTADALEWLQVSRSQNQTAEWRTHSSRTKSWSAENADSVAK